MPRHLPPKTPSESDNTPTPCLRASARRVGCECGVLDGRKRRHWGTGEMARGETKRRNDTMPLPRAPACGMDRRGLWRLNDKGNNRCNMMAQRHPHYKRKTAGLVCFIFIFIFHSLRYTPPPQVLLAGWIHMPALMMMPPSLQMRDGGAGFFLFLFSFS